MKKSFKMRLVTLLSFAFMLLLGAALVTASFATAADEDFYMSGVALRSEKTEDGEYGLKFYGYVSASKYDSSYEYGMEIAPADKLDSAKTVTCTPKADEKNSELYVITGAVTDIVAANTSRPFTARAFYSAGEGEKVYTDWAEAKSIYTVATQALADDSAELTDEIKAYLNGIVDGVQGKNAANNGLTGKYVINEITVESDGANFADKEFNIGDTFTVNASVKKDGDDTKILKAYPTVAATDESGAEIADVIEQVAGTQNTYKIIGAADSLKIVCKLGSEESYKIEQSESYAIRTKLYNASYNGEKYIINKNADASQSYTDASYVDLGSFENGGAVAVEFNGIVLPNIAFFAPAATNNIKDSSCMMMTSENPAADFRIYPKGNCIGGAAFANTWANGSQSNRESSGSYLFIAVAYKLDTNYRVSLNLYSKQDGEFVYLSSYKKVLTDFTVEGGNHIVVYGSRQVNVTNIGINAVESVNYASLFAKYGVSDCNAMKTYKSTVYQSSENVKQNILLQATSTSGTLITDSPYVDLGSFENGGTVVIEFTGKAKPQVAFFIESSERLSAMYKDTDNAIPCYLFAAEWANADYRMFGDTSQASAKIANKITEAAYNNLEANGKYVLALSCIKNANGTITAKISLYTNADGVLTLVATTTRSETAEEFAAASSGSHIVIFGSRSGLFGSSRQFTVSVGFNEEDALKYAGYVKDI